MFFSKLFTKEEEINLKKLNEKVNKSNEEILKLERKNQDLINEIESIKTYNKNLLKFIKLCTQSTLKLNDSNDDVKYIDILKDIEEFAKEYSTFFYKKDEDILKKISNQQKGKKGELQVYEIIENLKRNSKEFEFLHNITLSNKGYKRQIDFILISPSSSSNNRITIQLIEVKKYNVEELNILENDIEIKYQNRTITFSEKNKDISELKKIETGYKIMQEISKEIFKEDIKINWFNIIAFTDDINSSNSLLDKSNIKGEKINSENFKFDELTYIKYKENMNIGVLIGNENIKRYLEKYIPNNNKDNQHSRDLAFYIKNSLKSIENTDKRYIVGDIIQVFNEIYNYIENQ